MAENMTGAPMSLSGSVAIMMLCLAPFTVWGQGLSDPTRPPPGINDAASSTSGAVVYLQVRGVQSVIISPAHCAAIINGKTVVLGAKHGSERLIEVNERGVVLQGENGYRTLALFPAVGMKITDSLPQDQRAVKCKINQSMQGKNPAAQAEQKEKK